MPVDYAVLSKIHTVTQKEAPSYRIVGADCRGSGPVGCASRALQTTQSKKDAGTRSMFGILFEKEMMNEPSGASNARRRERSLKSPSVQDVRDQAARPV